MRSRFPSVQWSLITTTTIFLCVGICIPIEDKAKLDTGLFRTGFSVLTVEKSQTEIKTNRENFYTTFVCSFNAGGWNPTDQKVDLLDSFLDLVSDIKNKEDKQLPDIVAIGIQELVNPGTAVPRMLRERLKKFLNWKGIKKDSSGRSSGDGDIECDDSSDNCSDTSDNESNHKDSDTEHQNEVSIRGQKYREYIQNALNRKYGSSTTYELVKLNVQLTVAIFVFVKTNMKTNIVNVETSEVKRDQDYKELFTKLKVIPWLKGGVGVRFEIGNTSFCFVSFHLAAHTENLENRNKDFIGIYEDMRFKNEKKIDGHDHIFFFGDSNYRIISKTKEDPGKNNVDGLTRKDILDSIANEDFEKLMNYDQLRKEMKSEKKPFCLLSEPPLNFNPTFKIDPIGPNIIHYNEKRDPAYCDRILVILSSGVEMKGVKYIMVMANTLSDHKPVIGIYFCYKKKKTKEIT